MGFACAESNKHPQNKVVIGSHTMLVEVTLWENVSKALNVILVWAAVTNLYRLVA